MTHYYVTWLIDMARWYVPWLIPMSQVVVGGVIPEQDYAQLYDAGVISIFGPGTKITAAVVEVVEKLIPE